MRIFWKSDVPRVPTGWFEPWTPGMPVLKILKRTVMERKEAVAKQSQVRISHQLLLSFPQSVMGILWPNGVLWNAFGSVNPASKWTALLDQDSRPSTLIYFWNWNCVSLPPKWRRGHKITKKRLPNRILDWIQLARMEDSKSMAIVS